MFFCIRWMRTTGAKRMYSIKVRRPTADGCADRNRAERGTWRSVSALRAITSEKKLRNACFCGEKQFWDGRLKSRPVYFSQNVIFLTIHSCKREKDLV